MNLTSCFQITSPKGPNKLSFMKDIIFSDSKHILRSFQNFMYGLLFAQIEAERVNRQIREEKFKDSPSAGEAIEMQVLIKN